MGRWYPMLRVRVLHGARNVLRDALLDTGSDDTICPESLAQRLGIDLIGAPEGEGGGVSGSVVRVRYATVSLRITDGKEMCEWEAIVGFAPLGRNRLLLGQTGFLQFFNVTIFNPFREILLEPNGSFLGQHIIH